MDIRQTVIWEELESIFEGGSKGVHFRYSCEIDIDGELIVPLRLNSINVIRQYSKQFSDYIFLDILLPAGTYSKKLFPKRDNFLVTIFKEPIGEFSEDVDLSKEITTRTYKGSLIDAKSDTIQGKTQISNDEELLNNEVQNDYVIQLIDLAAEELKMRSVSTIVRDMKPDDVIKGLLTLNAGQLELDDNASVKGVDIVDADNKTVRSHYILPDGEVRVTSIPDYIQENCGGVYNTAMGHYLQNGIWYVYPQYNTERFDKTDRTLTVFNIPDRALPSVERTFKYEENKLIVVSTGKTYQVDESEKEQLSLGNGVRYARGIQFVEGFAAVKDHKVNVSADDNMVEYVVEDRKSGLNNVKMSDNRITSNHPNEMSKLSSRLGQIVATSWENSNPDLVYPGMPCKYVYINDDVIDEIYGVVLGIEYDVRLEGNGIGNPRHTCNSTIYLFLNRG